MAIPFRDGHNVELAALLIEPVDKIGGAFDHFQPLPFKESGQLLGECLGLVLISDDADLYGAW